MSDTTSSRKAQGQQKQEGEREQLQAQFNPSGNPRDVQRLGQRAVMCPVTGQAALISDAADSAKRSGGGGNTVESVSSSSTSSDDNIRALDAPTDAEYNILLHTFPQLPPDTFTSPLRKKIDRVALHSALAILASNAASVLLSLNRPASIALSAASAGAVYIYAHSAKSDYEKAIDMLRSETAVHRANKFTPPSPESAEWLNSLVASIWPLIDAKVFEAAVDMVEDIMHQSMPSMINSVKISDVSQGTNPFRLVYFRRLPPKVTGGKNPDVQDAGEADDQLEEGTFVNYELEVAYHAQPGMNVKHHNIHLLIEFFMSIKDLFNIPISVWAQLETFHATLRLRLQLTESPPYIGKLMFTFMGLPQVSISVQPLNKGLPNVLDLPFLNDFVQSSIAAACNAYVAPKSMTLDLGEILMGSGTKLETDATGVLQITIHRAKDLESKDANGGSDPYVICSLASLGKALHTTRVLKNDLNPVWEETCFYLVTPEDLKAHEELLLMLWDQDKGPSDDDLLGRIRVPLQELIDKPDQQREDKLMSLKGNKASQGTLYWSTNFYRKAKLLRPESAVSEGQKGSNGNRELTADVAPMDTEHLSGILSVTVHEVHHVERQLKPGHDPDKDDLPSPYAVVFVDGDRKFKTRTKQYSTQASFNKCEEMFINNWQTSQVRIVLHDSIPREKDPVLGEVFLPLKEFLNGRSQKTEVRSIQNGIGYGRMSLSMLFRSIDAKLPENYLTADRGIITVSSLAFKAQGGSELPSAKLRLSTKYDQVKVSGKTSKEQEGQTQWDLDEPLKLAFQTRHTSRLSIEFGRGFQIAGIGKDAEALATVQLGHLVDDKSLSLEIPVVSGDDIEDFQEHVLEDEQTLQNHHLKVLGHLLMKLSITPDIKARPMSKEDASGEGNGAGAQEESTSSAGPDRPHSPAGSLRQNFKSKKQRIKNMFKHSDSESE